MNDHPLMTRSAIAVVLASALLLALGCRTAEDGTAPVLPAVIPAEALPTALALPISMPPSDKAVAAPALLRLRETSGDDTRYLLSLHHKIRQRGRSLPTSESDIEQRLTLTERVTAETANRLVRHVAVSDVVIDFKPPVPDIEEAARDALEGLRFEVTSNPRGTVSEVSPVGQPNEAKRGALHVISAALTQSALRLPDKPVAPGARWPAQPKDDDIQLPTTVSDSLPAKLRASYELRGFTRLEGRKCAIIDVKLTMKVAGKLHADDTSADVRGAARGEGAVLFDIDRGLVVRSAYSLVFHQELLVTGTARAQLLEQDIQQTIALELQ